MNLALTIILGLLMVFLFKIVYDLVKIKNSLDLIILNSMGGHQKLAENLLKSIKSFDEIFDRLESQIREVNNIKLITVKQEKLINELENSVKVLKENVVIMKKNNDVDVNLSSKIDEQKKLIMKIVSDINGLKIKRKESITPE